MSFDEHEIAYLRSQRLARFSTVDDEGQPDVVPVGFVYEEPYIYVDGMAMEKTRKFRNIDSGNTKVALVIDDVVSVDPWTPRMLRIYGVADLVEREGGRGRGRSIRVTPTISWSTNLEGLPVDVSRKMATRRTVHEIPGAGTDVGRMSIS